MSISKIDELVSQSEIEGVTLASLISKHMSSDEISEAKEQLAIAIADGAERIEEFMSGIKIQSIWEILEEDALGLPEIVDEFEPVSSDE